MGIPKFFRYISERYPSLSELAREKSIPAFDNLYLDMNGIIHNCSHPDENNVQLNIPEDEIFREIFSYIERLFFLIKPQKLFFMAVDGVAPRAKMNQQRSRRFRSAKEAEQLENEMKRRGELIEGERFDSNCITPGTVFMVRLQKALQYFVKNKMSVDPIWQRCRIILSGQNCPGEGEHKIMSFIRYLKTRKDYDPNTRHCLYGLDADLIILGLCTHQKNFVILREEVKFARKAKKTSVHETRFFLLHLSLLREYLEIDFDSLRKSNASFNIESLIDDWVLMGFLVGNDFVPHLPGLHISSNALPLLYKAYMDAYPTLGGNINEKGKLNLERLEKFFQVLAGTEFEMFQENYADLKYFEAKQSNNGVDEAFDVDAEDILNDSTNKDLSDLIENSRKCFGNDSDDDDVDNGKTLEEEFVSYKKNYYMMKLGHDEMAREEKRLHVISYIDALQWILSYYYHGVQSWDWYYPYHYAPFISDIVEFKNHEIEFNLGEPFLPFEQLLAILPAASKQLLPDVYHRLMTDNDSVLKHFYPTNFEVDLNGKKNDWEAVVLLPFIDEALLLKAMKDCEDNLLQNEIERNRHGPMLQFDYVAESQGHMPAMYSMKAVAHIHCTETPIRSEEINVAIDDIVYCNKTDDGISDIYTPGFPTFKHLEYNFQLSCNRVKVFNHASKNESVILMPKERPGFDDLLTVSEQLLNKVVYIGWPHLSRAKVIAVSNEKSYIDADGTKTMNMSVFQSNMTTLHAHLTLRMGIVYSDLSTMTHVKLHDGRSYHCDNQGKITLKDTWKENVVAYPAQGVVININERKDESQQKMVETLYPVKTTIFFVGNPYFGSQGVILNPSLLYECGRLKISITVLPEPDVEEARKIQQNQDDKYISAYELSGMLGLNTKCIGRITGTVLVIAGARRTHNIENSPKTNIGLRLKFPKQKEERVGYTRYVNNQWYYSSKAVALVEAYCLKFPRVAEYFSSIREKMDCFFEVDLFPDNVGDGRIDEITAWLKEQSYMSCDILPCGSKMAVKDAIESVLVAIEQLKNMPVKTVTLQVKPHLLLKPEYSLASMYKSKRPIVLFDRVVVVQKTFLVSLGSRGTVIGIYPVSDSNPVRLECLKEVENFYEILFDKQSPNMNDAHGIAKERVYKVPESALLLIPSSAETTKPGQIAKHRDAPAKKHSKTTMNGSSSSKCDMKIDENEKNTVNVTKEQPSATPLPANQNEEFWMPSADIKKPSLPPKMNAEKVFMEEVAPSVNQKQQQRVHSADYASLHNDCQEETQTLKTWLGIKPTKSSIEHQAVNNVDICKKLPDPPENWRNRARNDCSVVNRYHQTNVMPPQSCYFGAYNFYTAAAAVPHIFPSQSAPIFNARPIVGGTMPPPTVPESMRPYVDNFRNRSAVSAVEHNNNAPSAMALRLQHCERGAFSPTKNNGKGAFIQLQDGSGRPYRHVDTRASVPCTNSRRINIMPHVNNDAVSTNEELIPRECGISLIGRSNSGEANVQNISAMHSQRRPPPRTPKIGAKFDHGY